MDFVGSMSIPFFEEPMANILGWYSTSLNLKMFKMLLTDAYHCLSLHTVKLSHSISVEFKSSKDMLYYSEHWCWSFTIYWSQRINNGVLLFSYCFHTNSTPTYWHWALKAVPSILSLWPWMEGGREEECWLAQLQWNTHPTQLGTQISLWHSTMVRPTTCIDNRVDLVGTGDLWH